MNQGEVDRDELEARLSELHAASFGWACACCRWNEMDAEDVLQTTYLKVISGKARFSGRSAFRTWLFGVIRLTAYERTRRLRVQSEGEGRLMIEAGTTDATRSGPVEHAENAERARILRDALLQLPERQREVLHLVFYEDLTVSEAAQAMEVSVGSARVHYDRGKKRLRAVLSDFETGGGAP